jgi:YidC/Oxa1 family membrane protein insertase
LVLMLVMLTIYFQFFSPEPQIPVIADNVNSTTPLNNSRDSVRLTNSENDQIALSDSARGQLNEFKYGLFSQNAIGNESVIDLSTDDLNITFSNKGGALKNIGLKNYTTYDSTSLNLFDNNHHINIIFEHLSKNISFGDLYFQPKVVTYADSTVVDYTLVVNGNSLHQIYTLHQKGFEINYRIESKGFERIIDPKDLKFLWEGQMPKIEREITDSRQRATVRYYTNSANSDYISKSSTTFEEMAIDEPVKWMAFNQKFFTAAIIADKNFNKGRMTLNTPIDDQNVVKEGSLEAEIPFTALAIGDTRYTFFFGPNKYSILKEVTDGFSNNIELGWLFLPFINKYLIIPIFNYLELFFSNYGLIIILMVLIIRIILSPLTYKSHISMAKMRVLKPELDAIKEKHGGDMQKAQADQMDLYRKVGINPLSGCIPVLLQFPILVSLFYFIPSAIELRLESFLWADDLSSYDSIFSLPFNIPFYGDHVSLFTLLMAGSTILYTMANAQMTTVQGPMKTMQYLMPIMFLFFFNSYPSGLSYYYFITNLVSFGQIMLFRKFVDEDKIKLIMEENKKKNVNKTKSKFQSRLEEAMKANQTAQSKNKKK